MSTSPPFAITMHAPLHSQLQCYYTATPMGMEVATGEVDTSRPFQSVREAVEVFGERRRHAGGGRSDGSSAAPAPSSSVMLEECLKKLEEEVALAKGEVVELRQRQAQMEVAVSSLSVQFSKGLAVYSSSSLSKGKEVAVVAGVGEDEDSGGHGRVRSDRWDESRAEQWVASLEYLPSLSEALAIKMVDDDDLAAGDRRKKERKVTKKKKSKNKAASAGAGRSKKHRSAGISLQLVGGMFCAKKAKSR